MKDRNNIAIHAIADQFQTVIAKCVDKPQFTVLSSIASDSEAFKIVISAIVWGLRQFSLFRMYGSVASRELAYTRAKRYRHRRNGVCLAS